MGELKAIMLFSVGEMVYIKSAANDRLSTPNQHVITERYLQECHGGIQKLYKLYGALDLVPEIVLTRDEPTFRPISKDFLAENMLLTKG